tara:strand:+ start:5768 stop:6805 length:1038 start_codon:yes stop_codon:yes gene_type:complete
MASFSTQITTLSGSAGTNTLDYFNQGLIDATQRLLIVNPSIIPKLETETITEDNDTGSGDNNVNDGISIENQGMLISVAREDKISNNGTDESPTYTIGKRIANQINPNDRFIAEDTSSLKRATNYHPKYYVLNGKVFILPQLSNATSGADGNPSRDNGIVTYIKIPKLTSTSITGVVATTADPTVFGKTDHGLLTGDIVTLSGFIQMTQINGMTGTVTKIGANSFNVNSVAGDPQETTGGTVTIITRNGISYGLESSSITGFPEEYYRAPILYASIKVIQELIKTDNATLQTLIETDEDPELATLQIQKLDERIKQQQLLQAEYEKIFMPYQVPSKEEPQQGARQ